MLNTPITSKTKQTLVSQTAIWSTYVNVQPGNHLQLVSMLQECGGLMAVENCREFECKKLTFLQHMKVNFG